MDYSNPLKPPETVDNQASNDKLSPYRVDWLIVQEIDVGTQTGVTTFDSFPDSIIVKLKNGQRIRIPVNII